jgi:hypothetical protein
MTHRELIHRIGLREYWKLCSIINEAAGMPPHTHAQSAEEQKQCAECREWHRNFEQIWEEVFGPFLEDNGEKKH